MITDDKKQRTGALKQRVMFQREEKVSDGMGNTYPDWQDDFQAWANIKPMSVRQRLELQAVSSNVTHEITVRHRPNKSLAGRRVKWGNRAFNIHGYYTKGEEGAYDKLIAAEALQP